MRPLARINIAALAVALLSAQSACVTERAPAVAQVVAPATPTRAAEGSQGAIATAHGLASDVGLAVLKAGGNAMDAAIASSFAISVLRPQSTGIGGGGFLLWHDAATRRVEVFDFRERAPRKATKTMYVDASGKPRSFTYQSKILADASVNGHLAVGTPGLVAGLWDAHRAHGKLPWATLVAPAIKLASEGFPVYRGLAEALRERAEVLKVFEGSRAIFSGLEEGDTLIQKDLAWTLTQIAEKGPAGFYSGPVAERIVAELRQGGGILDAEDLQSYRVKRRQPVEGVYRGYRIVSMPPPSSGGVHIVQMLNMLAGDDLSRLGLDTPAGMHLLAETMRRAFADRAHWLGDPDFVAVPVKGLVSPAYAAKLRRTIDARRASRSAEIRHGEPGKESRSTTHLSVMDRAGNAVSSTQTINYAFGSGVVARGTGVVLNDEMDDFAIQPNQPNVFGLVTGEANAVAAHKTMLSSMSPTFVYGKDGSLLALGSPGGPRIISATLQVILNVVDRRLPLPEAVEAPRLHHQWLPDRLRVEKGRVAPATLAELKKLGHEIDEAGPIGDVQAVMRKAEGGFVAASDSRSDGEARAY